MPEHDIALSIQVLGQVVRGARGTPLLSDIALRSVMAAVHQMLAAVAGREHGRSSPDASAHPNTRVCTPKIACYVSMCVLSVSCVVLKITPCHSCIELYQVHSNIPFQGKSVRNLVCTYNYV